MKSKSDTSEVVEGEHLDCRVEGSELIIMNISLAVDTVAAALDFSLYLNIAKFAEVFGKDDDDSWVVEKYKKMQKDFCAFYMHLDGPFRRRFMQAALWYAESHK